MFCSVLRRRGLIRLCVIMTSVLYSAEFWRYFYKLVLGYTWDMYSRKKDEMEQTLGSRRTEAVLQQAQSLCSFMLLFFCFLMICFHWCVLFYLPSEISCIFWAKLYFLNFFFFRWWIHLVVCVGCCSFLNPY